MRRRFTTALSTAAIAAVLGLPGCANDEEDTTPPPAAAQAPSKPPRVVSPQAGPLPAPDALAGVLYRLADVTVPGPQKLSLVEGSTPESAGVYDQFANALINGGFAPVKFDVRDVSWSDRDPADVVANVDVSSTLPRGPRFGFPMEFKPFHAGWQLSARTAEALLAFRTDNVEPAPTPGR